MDQFADKEGLLQAVAQAGSQGAQDYATAQAALAAQQKQAIQGALATSVPLTAEQQGAVGGLINAGYTPHETQLASNNTVNQNYIAQTGAQGAKFNNTLRDTILPAELAANAASASGGGGGGGGGGRGGGGGGSSSSNDWQKALKDAFGSTQGYQQAGLLAAAHANRDKSLPVILQARQIAEQQLGVPTYAAEKLVPMGGFLKTALDNIQSAKTNGVTLQQYTRTVRQQAKAAPGNQNAAAAYAIQQAASILKRGKKK